MAAVLTAAEMRALERAAIESGRVTGLELMERAGQGVVEAILAEWPGIEEGARRAVLLCGPGNNGGDGFVVARLLKERGWAVEVFLLGEAGRLPTDARVNHDRWLGLGQVYPLDQRLGDWFAELGTHDHPNLWIDALFGTGLARPLDAAAGAVLDGIGVAFANFLVLSPGPIVAVDVPSGLDADSGRVLHDPPAQQDEEPILVRDLNVLGRDPGDPPPYPPLPADLTVTFHGLKPGHLLADGPAICGKVVVADIGLFASAGPSGTSPAWEVDVDRTRLRKRSGHKYGHGHALVLGGSVGRGGAARMAARGALRIGAGLVTVAVPPGALQENAGALDAVMLRSVRDADALRAVLSDDRINALCVGPGFGTGEREADLLAALLEATKPIDSDGDAVVPSRSLVIDADALTLLSSRPDLRAGLHRTCVLTPHEGEFARLFPEIDATWRAPATDGPAFSKLDAVRRAARQSGAAVLLKGPDTVIAEGVRPRPPGVRATWEPRAAINAAVYDRAAPWLATAGSGDVLAGFITGLLARGFAPFDAACTAAWLHVECARSFGPGLIAEDLPEELPKVFRSLGL